MEADKVAELDGKARRVRNVSESHKLIDKAYGITIFSGSEITPRGHLLIAVLQPTDPSIGLPTFEFRWDEKDDALDVDAVGRVSKQMALKFKRGTAGHHGHHTRRVPTGPRVFEADIVWGGRQVYLGQIGFSLERDFEVKDGVCLAEEAGISVTEASSTLGVSAQHLRHLLARGTIDGKKFGRDWVVLRLDYKRKRKPKTVKRPDRERGKQQ